jgi:SAM-dependent methyltransferase
VTPSHDPASSGTPANAALRARSFGAVADAYDRIRPGYPAELFDDVIAYAGSTARILEVGAGTGRATAALAGHGFAVHAIEPDAVMAEVLRERCEQWPLVEVTVASFEQEPTDGSYDLLLSAQAWHWVDPHQRWIRAAAVLRTGGALALFWNHDHPRNAELRRRLQAAHDRWTPGIQVDDSVPDGDVSGEWPGSQLAKLAEFTDLETRRYGWERVLSAADYVELLSTMSAYNVRPSAAREGLFAEVLEIAGDVVVLRMDTVLYLARRT